MKLRRSIAVAVFAVVAILAPVLHASPASAASAGEFISSINGLRASKGIGSLSSDGALAAQAQRWAQAMADAGKISHNPNLGSTPGNWKKVGENVGTGGSVSSIHQALVNSPGHYRNMVDSSFNKIGVGVAVGSDGRIYTCHVFANIPGASGESGSKASSGGSPAARPAASSGSKKPAAAPASKKPTPAANGGSVPAPASAPAASAPADAADPAAAAPAGPVASDRIVASLAEVGAITTQG